ncbi:MAG: LysR family transcriptional regulator [Roseococcus sp.]|nr:LysR family transcriptional regulator [Roseococcus sp.]
MELTWLEDFLALAEHRNFSRAAEARHVTQPAFSRRIQALEQWVGTALVLRSPQGVQLNAAGAALHAGAAELVRDLHQLRRVALRAAGREGAALSIAATHALSFTFLPGWIRGLELPGTLTLLSDTMAACEALLLAGDADLLLGHAHRDMPSRLPADAFTSLVIGRDVLVPVMAPGAGFRLPGRPGTPVPLLAYSEASGLGRILRAARAGWEEAPQLEASVTAPLAATLQSLARQGQGVAWLPRSLAAEDLAAGQLVEAGAASFSIALEITLIRPRRRLSATAEACWAAASRRETCPDQSLRQDGSRA